MTSFLSPSGAWASGAIVSTPADLAAFIRADLGLKFFGAAEQQEQMQFVPGDSGPPTPDGTRSVTTTLNLSAPTGELLERLREVQGQAVCALLGR